MIDQINNQSRVVVIGALAQKAPVQRKRSKMAGIPAKIKGAAGAAAKFSPVIGLPFAIKGLADLSDEKKLNHDSKIAIIGNTNLILSSINTTLRVPTLVSSSKAVATFMQGATAPFTAIIGVLNLITAAISFDAARQTLKTRSALKADLKNNRWNVAKIKSAFDLKTYTPPTDQAQKKIHAEAFSKRLFSKALKYCIEGTAALVAVAAGIVFLATAVSLPVTIGFIVAGVALVLTAMIIDSRSQKQFNKTLGITETAEANLQPKKQAYAFNTSRTKAKVAPIMINRSTNKIAVAA